MDCHYSSQSVEVFLKSHKRFELAVSVSFFYGGPLTFHNCLFVKPYFVNIHSISSGKPQETSDKSYNGYIP